MSSEGEPAASGNTENKALFRDIAADDYDPEIMEMESLCISCEEQGTTRLFLTKIPFFREVIIASFSCDHCGYKNAELQPGGKIQDRGVSYRVHVKTIKDLNRQVVQTEYCSIKIPELEFEVPPGKGALTTIEGVIDRALEGLEQGQIIRRIQQPDIAAQIDEFLVKLGALKTVEKPFDLVLDDPSGNSFLENPLAPSKDKEMIVSHYARTVDQDRLLGLVADDDDGKAGVTAAAAEAEAEKPVVGQDDGEGFNTQNEVLQFQVSCPGCGSQCSTNMKLVNIPHFKEVVIMATVCDACGHRDNEVKSSGGIEAEGTRIELTINTAEDIARDVLKSETSTILIPDLDFETEMGTLGGKFSTVEGLLEDIKSQLKTSNPFFHGDSSQPEVVNKLSDFCNRVDEIIKGKVKGFRFIVDDPAGNSYIQSLCAPDPDPQLKISNYTRTHQQNEELGLNDMKTENY